MYREKIEPVGIDRRLVGLGGVGKVEEWGWGWLLRNTENVQLYEKILKIIVSGTLEAGIL